MLHRSASTPTRQSTLSRLTFPPTARLRHRGRDEPGDLRRPA
jgi:hypothetical protein